VDAGRGDQVRRDRAQGLTSCAERAIIRSVSRDKEKGKTMDEGYDTWIANLMAGRQSAEDQAARERFRAMQATPAPRAVTARPAAVASAGPNTWAVSDRSDGLAQFSLLDGPGRWANCAGR
jgi:hypothetical protein